LHAAAAAAWASCHFFSKLRGLPVEQLPWSVRAKASRSLLLGFARFPLFSFFFLRRFAELSRPNPQRRGGKNISAR